MDITRKRQVVTAIIYDKKGRPLSLGKNSYLKTHTYQAQLAKEVGMPEKQYIHAEVDAIIRLRNPEKAYRILVTRHGPDGTFMLAKPCPVCVRAIKLAGIRVVEHT